MARKRRLTVKKGPENVSGSLNKSIPSSSCPSPPPRKSRRISRQPRSIQHVTMKRQSPIDIRTETVCEDAEHCQIESVKIDYVVGDCKSVSCSPGGWKVQVRDNCSSFFAARHLPAKFKLEQFHAHWSEDGSCGSEHTLNGRPLSGEVHFVFYNTTYGSFANALAQDDGLAVIGVFIKEGEHNDNYQPLVDCIRNAAETGHEQEMPTYFHIRQLLPPLDERDFVTYEGSLTTPPYSEAVIWTVLTHPVEISAEQLNVFRQIVPKNYRDCQDLCDRRVRVTRAAAVAH